MAPEHAFIQMRNHLDAALQEFGRKMRAWDAMVKRQGGEHYWTCRVDNTWGGRRG